MKKKEKDNEMAPTIGFWMPEQAEMVPLPKGENFARYLANGDVLMPIHWVFLYLHAHPDLEGVVLGFRSTGNRVCSQLQKLLKRESTLCTELRLKIGRQGIRNETYARTIQYPDFDIAGKNFDYVDGNVVSVKGGLGVKELKVILTRSKEIHEDYAQHRMVAARSQESLKALIGSPAVGSNTQKPACAGGFAGTVGAMAHKADTRVHGTLMPVAPVDLLQIYMQKIHKRNKTAREPNRRAPQTQSLSSHIEYHRLPV
jgi:hypothetical protein